MINSRIGPYAVVSKIGEGGMGEVRLGEPHVLFEKRFGFGQSITLANHSLSHDGREFLMVEGLPGGRHLDLVLNWLQTLGK